VRPTKINVCDADTAPNVGFVDDGGDLLFGFTMSDLPFSMKFRPITMASVRPCGCKGIRTCLICEQEYGIAKKDFLAMRQVCMIIITSSLNLFVETLCWIVDLSMMLLHNNIIFFTALLNPASM
jgi:hypothetical protein